MNPYGVRVLFSPALDPPADDADWREAALCTQADPAAWYPEKGGPTRRPKAICRRCPSRVPCLRLALEASSGYGIWAGLSPDEREVAAREHKAGMSLEAIIDAADESWDTRMAAASEHSRTAGAAAAARTAA